MNDVQRMDVLNSGNNLLEKLAGLFFGDPRVLDDVVKEFAPTGILHYQVELPWSLNYFIKLHDVGVADQL